MAADATGEQIFRAACATCHAADGTGAPKSVVGFDIANGHSLPDFTDCATNTVEPLADWVAVAHEGGPIRGLDRHMPAFGEALSIEQIERTDQIPVVVLRRHVVAARRSELPRARSSPRRRFRKTRA
jgi:mono/diheme cytochrome c family protein